jgi:predicted O-methyltransferase YrrM
MYDIPNFYDLDEENEIEISKNLSKEFDLIFFDATKRYYEENR